MARSLQNNSSVFPRQPQCLSFLFFLGFFFAISPLVVVNAQFVLPKVDFSRMGHVGLAGAFAGLDLFSNSSSTTSSSIQLDAQTSTLVLRAFDGSLSTLGSTNEGGQILAACALGDALYVAGSFSSINGTSASNVVSYSPTGQSFTALSSSNAPNGQVSAIFCDEKDNKVWVGGSFSSPAQGVAVWDVKSSSWSAPPFGGLNGPVTSITTNASDASLFFSGSFITSFGASNSNTTIVLNSTNNNPNIPFSAGATPFSSSLVPIPLQNVSIDPSPPSSDARFSNFSNVLCPTGADGPGETWLAADGFKAVINVRAFAQLSASGIRIGNTFAEGRSTTGFSVVSLPDNVQLTLKYTDPTTGTNNTCTDLCPLLTDSSIPYQDFLFSTPSISLTGFQLTLSEWTGAGPGIHLLQLLSAGAFASAVEARNMQSCFAPQASEVNLVGAWTEKSVTTDIAGTLQDVVVAQVPVGQAASQSPTVTWKPYVSAAGNYTISALIPGCSTFNDCALRTTVTFSVFPGTGFSTPFQTTVSQATTTDSTTVIYQGPVIPSTSDFTTTISMAIAATPEGQGQNGDFEIVADRIDLQLVNVVNGTVTVTGGGGNGTASGNGTSGTQEGFGFFEWPLANSNGVNATGTLANSSETTLDVIGVQVFRALGSTTSGNVINAVAHHSSGAIFLGGSFNFSSSSGLSSANVVAYKNGALTPLSAGGLDGTVKALLIQSDMLYVGGTFNDTASSSTSGKARGVVSYNVSADSWGALQAGVDGAVSSLAFDNGNLTVVGAFSNTLPASSSGSASPVGGLAVWSANEGAWVNSGGFVVGDLTMAGNSTAPSKGNQGQAQVIAGNLKAVRAVGASGFVTLQNGNNGAPSVVPLGINLLPLPTTSSTNAKRSIVNKRQSSSSLSPLPTPSPAIAPAVLAGAFWTNTSDSRDIAIIGGNFSFTSSNAGQSSAVAIYDLSTQSLTALAGSPLNGTVRALLVVGNELYIGGEFSVSGTQLQGIAVYDLANEKLDVSSLQALQASSGESVSVRSITQSASKSGEVIVAGSFTSAGGASQCAGICALDISSKAWSALGGGVLGEVAAVAYGGNNQDVLFASGSLAIPSGSISTTSNVAMFSFENSTWTVVGDAASKIPGPVTALTTDNGNSSSVFAAGSSTNGSASFLSFYNGQSWTSLSSGFESQTTINQLTMVPLQDTHAANSIIEKDRMLLLSGSIVSSSFGNASSALFDGQNIIPYLVTSGQDGSPGAISSLFSSISNFTFNQRHFLATGVVILISIAISAGVIFLLVLIGILWTLFSRRGDHGKADPAEYYEDDDSLNRPSSLLEHVNAATRSTILQGVGGAASPWSVYGNKEKSPENDVLETGAALSSSHPFVTGATNNNHLNDGDFIRAETPSDAAAGLGLGMDEQGRPAHARYSFDGLGEGELAIAQGTQLEVLDDRDHDWWYARDTKTGREGVVPASYLY